MNLREIVDLIKRPWWRPGSEDLRAWRLPLLSVAVGVVAGLGAIAFFYMLDGATWLFQDCLAGYSPPGPGGEGDLFPALHREFNRWVLFVLPALGGLASGYVVYRFAPEAEGHGTDAAIEAYHHKAGKVRARIPFVKAIASAITIGTGGSGGREGPIAQIGSGFGSMLATALRLSPRERRILMAAGMAGGVGAIFHAPMAGAIFAAEVLYRDLELEYEVLIPAIISSIIAYAVFALQFGWDPLFVTPGFVFERPSHLIFYIVLALAVAAGAVAYIKVFYGVHRLFKRWSIPNYFKPAVGGLVVGAIGLFLPQALGTGYGSIQKALATGTGLESTFGSIGVGLLLAIFAGKIVTTAFSIGSGGSGGVFGPAVVIGGALGGVVGQTLNHVFPGAGIQPGAFVVVGMAGFFAAAANTPISTIIMVSEMTGNYHLLVPSMWVCILAYLLVRRHSLYERQLKNRFEAPNHLGNMMEAVLKNVRVADVLARRLTARAFTVPSRTRLGELMTHFANLEQSSFPVVDDEGHLIGIVKGRELRSVIGGDAMLAQTIIAEDIMRPPVTIRESDSLLKAVRLMADNDVEELVVVSAIDPNRLLTTLSHGNIVAAYHAEIVQRRDPGDV